MKRIFARFIDFAIVLILLFPAVCFADLKGVIQNPSAVLSTGSFTSGDCVQFASSGTSGPRVSDAGAPCGSGGGGAVSSVSNSDGTLTISPTTGAVVGSINHAHANTWTAAQTFQSAYTGQAPSGAELILNNTAATGQNILSFTVQNVAKGQIRSDFNGNLSYAAYGSGVHTFYTNGDYPGGTPNVILGPTTSLDGGGILTDGAGALEVATQITWGSAGGPWTLAADGSINSSLWNIQGSNGRVSFDSGSFTSDGSGNVTANNFTANSAVNTSVLNATGVVTLSKAGASSASAVNITGTPFSGTGTTSTPLVYFNNAVTQPTTWTTGGTYLGMNAVSGYTGNFLNFRLNGGSSLFTVDINGAVTSASNGNFANVTASAGGHFNFSGQSQIKSPSDGVLELLNAAGTGFTSEQYGGTTASFPEIKRNLTALNFRLADDSADAPITSAAHTITSASANCLDAGLNGSTNPVLQIDCSIASQATGVSIQGSAAGGGTTIQAISSGASEKMFVLAKGSQILYTGSSASGGQQNISLGGTTVASFMFSQTSFTPQASSTAATIRFATTAINDTALTASTEAPWAYFNMAATRQHATGSLTTQRDFRITGSTHSFVGASTLSDLSALELDGYAQAGTNATVTSAEALSIPTQAVAGTVTSAYGIKAATPTGATNNYAAQFTGPIDLEGSVPVITTCGSGSIVTGSNTHKGQITGITAATACTITFASGQPLPSPPTCTFTTNSALTPTISTISTTAVTTAMTALTGTLYYQCF